MKLPSLWSSGQEMMADPFKSFRREMEDMLRAFDRYRLELARNAWPNCSFTRT